MYKHLRVRKDYEDLYDRLTVESGRRHMVGYESFYAEFENKLPKDDSIDRPGNSLILNVAYMNLVGYELLRSYEERDHRLLEWITRDEAKDEQITAARLAEEPTCKHCFKQGLRIIDKSLMRRGRNKKYDPDDPEEVLFMLECPHCNKNSAYWEDGTAWDIKPTLCPKCKTEATHKSSRSKKALIITYTCPECANVFKERLDLHVKDEEKPDPDYDKDRAYFCLGDKEFREKLITIRRDFEDMARMSKEWTEKEKNKDVYDAVEQLKKLKIGELVPLLAPGIEKAGYTEFSLDKPEIGKDVIIGFNCLDSNTERQDYDSRSTLKKLIENALKDTNWRLTTDGISYRLGYLNGRMRAYENESDLVKLVSQVKKIPINRKSRRGDLRN